LNEFNSALLVSVIPAVKKALKKIAVETVGLSLDIPSNTNLTRS